MDQTTDVLNATMLNNLATALIKQGKFQEAAKLFCKANRVERAIEMFTDLRKWEAVSYTHLTLPTILLV